jgi:hypothetical protein
MSSEEGIEQSIVAGALEIMQRIETQVSMLATFRQVEVEARLNKQAREKDLKDVLNMATIETMAMIGPAVDPMTGRSNADYGKLLVERELRSHGQYQDALRAYDQADMTWTRAQVELNQAVDSLAASRTIGRIATGILVFVGDDSPYRGSTATSKEETSD